jgi:Zn-dependent protease with chaperone function
MKLNKRTTPIGCLISFVFILMSTKAFSQDLVFLNNNIVIDGFVDTTTIRSKQIRISSADFNTHQLIDSASIVFIQNVYGKIIFPNYVIVNPESQTIHWPNANHVLPNSKYLHFSSVSDAKRSGYKICPACFNEDLILPYDYLERGISYATYNEFRKNYEILNDHEKLSKVNLLLEEILKNWPTKTRGYNYKVYAYKGDPNALAIARGIIFISTGLLELLENDDEIRAVLSHEVAHIENRHSLRQYLQDQKIKLSTQLALLFTSVVTNVVTTLAKITNPRDVIYQINYEMLRIYDIAIALAKAGYSRELEQEADIIAQRYFYLNDLNKTAMVNLLNKLAYYSLIRNGTIGASDAYSSHPYLVNRINQINNTYTLFLDQALKLSVRTKSEYGVSTSFAQIIINSITSMPSSLDLEEDNIFLMGTISNFNKSTSIRVDKLQLRLPEKTFPIRFGGLTDTYVYRGQTTEISIYANLSKSDSIMLLNELKTRKNFNLEINLSYMNQDLKNQKAEVLYKPIPNIVTTIDE